MFDYITGKVVSRHPTFVVLETGGIGYMLHITLHAYDQIVENAQEKSYTWPAVTEDAHRLWGFKDPAERDVFCTSFPFQALALIPPAWSCQA
jgi:Holliday junction DNA helicase RuvA